MPDGMLNVFYIIISLFVSAIFWLKNSNKGIDRVLVSIHSVLLLVTFAWATLFGYILQIHNSALLEIIFMIFIVVSVFSIGFSLHSFTGSKWYHLLHLWNIFALLLTLFVGLMALSNDWL